MLRRQKHFMQKSVKHDRKKNKNQVHHIAMHERRKFKCFKWNNKHCKWHRWFQFCFFKRQWFEKRLIFDKSFSREQKIKLLHVKIKKFENFVIWTIFVEMHILILVSDLKSIINFKNNRQLNFTSLVYIFRIKIKIALMIDTKASKRIFINRKYIKFYKFFIVRLQKSIKLKLTDDKLVLNIIYMIQITFNLNDYINMCWCLITNLNKYNIILNMP